ncbi:hypothetical protein DM02DRAFT_654882 [Periconia macrospinosa]|uniref:Uncharacterized protein n=1 Tax=Periconia macrospinosa TaxID=97972 RepID=A0A2V1DS99_9PLEO|nr:hypothetical protein DM02DRAFT_654882 [Periconia macrospinosa]
MADLLSLAAGSFAVVGAVDVVVKVSTECYRFLSAIKSAPEEIDRLKTCIEENRTLIEAFKTHLDGLQNIAAGSSASSMEERFNLFNSAIKSFNRELKTLKTLEARYKGTSNMWSAIRHLLDERKLDRCMRNLENSRTMSSAAFMLAEGMRSAACHKDLEAVVERNFVHSAKMAKKLQEKGRIIRREIAARSAQQQNLASCIRREVRDNTLLSKTQHAEIRARIDHGNQMVIDTMISRLSGEGVTKVGQLCEYHCVGSSREMIFDLLGYMKVPVRKAVMMAIAKCLDAGWVQEEFAKLSQSAAQEHAALYRRSTATSVDPLSTPHHASREAQILYIPTEDVCLISLAIRFAHKLTENSAKPRFYTQLNAFHLVKSPILHWDFIAKSTLEKVDLAFRSGTISPYDKIRAGWMVCFRAAGKYFRSDILRYLHCQGVCISSVDAEDDVLSGAWGSLQSVELDAQSEKSLGEILQIIAETCMNGLSAPNTVLLHAFCWVPTRDVSGRRKRMIRTMLAFLKDRGYDFNLPNLHGRSPLLDHMLARGGASLVIAGMLLELGADPNAVDRRGDNAIQLAMFSNVA